MRFLPLILFLLLKVSMVLFFESLCSEIITVCQILIILYNYIFYPHPCWCLTEWWNNGMLSSCWNWQNGLATNWWIPGADTVSLFDYFAHDWTHLIKFLFLETSVSTGPGEPGLHLFCSQLNTQNSVPRI